MCFEGVEGELFRLPNQMNVSLRVALDQKEDAQSQ